jgi:hypothetical protein
MAQKPLPEWKGVLKLQVPISAPPGKHWAAQYGTVKAHRDGWLACCRGRRIVCASADEAIGWVMAISAVEKGIL